MPNGANNTKHQSSLTLGYVRDAMVAPAFEVKQKVLQLVVQRIIPTASLDVIALVASSCGYYRGQIEQHAAQ
jgi:hypothetical protein